MNLKAVLLVCLVFFGATLFTSTAITTMISPTSLTNALNTSNGTILDVGLVMPMGDPVDDPAAPT